MTRAKLVGDHSSYHCGAAAVWQVLSDWAERQGLERARGGEDFDVIIVNGEGSMHHGRPTFHRKMRDLEAAVAEGKRAYLVNTVWQSNPHDYDAVLAQLTDVYSRDPLSAADLLQNHARQSRQSIDLSYFAPVLPAADASDFGGSIVRTDYLDPATGDFAEMTDARFTGFPVHSLKGQSWSSYVAGLRTASLLVTGRHHAVYAACRARTPFAAVEGNSHKIRGIISATNTGIPIAEKESDLPDLIAWVESHADAFKRLFDWIEAKATQGVDGFVLPRL
jgi:hypothetical protein